MLLCLYTLSKTFILQIDASLAHDSLNDFHSQLIEIN